MYQIQCDGYVLHDTRLKNLQVVSPKCSIQLRKTGILTFQIASTHPYYDKIHKHTSEITLYQDGTVLFCGRVLNDEIDFYNIKNVECEGELSYFLDSIQRRKEYHLDGGSQNVIETYLRDLVSIHNSQVDDRKKFQVGTVTVGDSNNYLYNISNYQNTLECLNNKLVGSYGGYLQIRHVDGVKYIDYLSELTKSCSQTIKFGKNLIDMTKYIKGEDIYTALIPLGAKLESDESAAESMERYVDISSVPDCTEGTIVKVSDYIYDSEAVKKYGWIWHAEKWDDVTISDNLFTKAKKELQNSIVETLTLELTVIDLHHLGVDVEKISLGDKIQVVSIPHQLNIIMIVEKMDIDIDNPQNTKITLILPERFVSKDTSYSNGKNTSDKKIQEVKEIVAEGLVNYDDLKQFEEKVIKVDPLDPDKINSIPDLKKWTNNTHLQVSKGDPIKSVADMKQWVKDNTLSSTNPDGTSINLSEYAKIVDVNNAFNQLASALGGV